MGAVSERAMKSKVHMIKSFRRQQTRDIFRYSFVLGMNRVHLHPPPPLPTRTVAVSLIAMCLAHIWLYFPIHGPTKTHARPTMLPQRNILHRTSVRAVQSLPDLSSHTVSFHWVACFFPSPSCSLLKVKKTLRVSSLVLVFFQGCNCGRDLLSVSTKKPPMLYLFLPNQSHWKSKC